MLRIRAYDRAVTAIAETPSRAGVVRPTRSTTAVLIGFLPEEFERQASFSLETLGMARPTERELIGAQRGQLLC